MFLVRRGHFLDILASRFVGCVVGAVLVPLLLIHQSIGLSIRCQYVGLTGWGLEKLLTVSDGLIV